VFARVGEIIRDSPGLDTETIEHISETLGELLRFDRFSITRRELSTNNFILGPAAGADTYATGHRISLNLEVVDRIFGDHNVHVFDESGLDEIIETAPGIQTIPDLGFRTMMAVALRWQGELIGFIAFLSRQPEAYDEHDMTIASRLGSSMSVALATADRFELLEQQVTIRNMVADLTRSLMSDSPVDLALHTFIKNLVDFFDVDRASLGTFDKNRNYPYRGVGYDRQNAEFDVVVTDHRTPGGLRDLLADPTPRLLGRKQLEEFARTIVPKRTRPEEGFVVMAVVGLEWQGESVGSIAIWSGDDRSLTEESVTLLGHIAGQVATAIGNVQLTNRLESDFDSKASISEMAEAISSAESVDAGFEKFTRLMHEFFDSASVSLSILEPGTWGFTDAYRYDISDGFDHIKIVNLTLPAKFFEELKGRSATMVDKQLMEKYAPEFPPLADRLARGFESLATAVLWWQGNAVGALVLYLRDGKILDDNELRQLDRIAEHVSGAIGYLLLNRRLEDGFDQQSALAQIGQVVGSEMDIEAVFTQVVPLLRRLIEFDQLRVTTADVEAGTTLTVFGFEPETGYYAPNRVLPLAGSHTALVLASNKPLRVTVAPYGSTSVDPSALVEREPRGHKSAVAVPLVLDGINFGAIVFRSFSDAAFDTVPDALLL
jgi:transcriptional regulator with GAF, ATPase, and Fis domain